MNAVAPLLLAILSVMALVVLVRVLAPTHIPQLSSPAEAAMLADWLPGGFAVAACALDRAGHGAVLRDATGRMAVVAPLGAHFVVRLVDTARAAGNGWLELRGGDMACQLDLGPEAAAWAQAIGRVSV